jgi:hypothetical protein
MEVQRNRAGVATPITMTSLPSAEINAFCGVRQAAVLLLEIHGQWIPLGAAFDRQISALAPVQAP